MPLRVLAWIALSGCGEPAPYDCTEDGQCVVDGDQGRCEVNGFCSYAAPDCEAQRRWGPFAAGELADRCLVAVTVEAAYAACAGPSTGPAACEGFAGPGRLEVDLLDGDTDEPAWAFLRFDLDDVVGRTVTAARLRMTAAGDDTADSDASGRVVEVDPFTAADLDAGLPTGTGVLAGGLGAVGFGQTVEWTLDPAALPEEADALFLAIEPESSDNVQYVAAGADGPRLLLELAR